MPVTAEQRYAECIQLIKDIKLPKVIEEDYLRRMANHFEVLRTAKATSKNRLLIMTCNQVYLTESSCKKFYKNLYMVKIPAFAIENEVFVPCDVGKETFLQCDIREKLFNVNGKPCSYEEAIDEAFGIAGNYFVDCANLE